MTNSRITSLQLPQDVTTSSPHGATVPRVRRQPPVRLHAGEAKELLVLPACCPVFVAHMCISTLWASPFHTHTRARSHELRSRPDVCVCVCVSKSIASLAFTIAHCVNVSCDVWSYAGYVHTHMLLSNSCRPELSASLPREGKSISSQYY